MLLVQLQQVMDFRRDVGETRTNLYESNPCKTACDVMMGENVKKNIERIDVNNLVRGLRIYAMLISFYNQLW